MTPLSGSKVSKNLRAFAFLILNKNMFNGLLKTRFFIDISLRNLKSLIALVVHLIRIFTSFAIS